MILLDTNLWVFGTLATNDPAERLLDDIERGDTVSAINAYMVQEALEAFDRTPGPLVVMAPSHCSITAARQPTPSYSPD